MKVLMVNKFLYPKGGAETYMLELGAWLSRNGCELQYFGMADEKNTVSNELGLYTHPLDFHRKSPAVITYPARIIDSGEARRELSALIDRFHPDIIHFNNINFQLTPSVIEAAHAKGVRCVQTVHDLQMLCPNHLMYNVSTEAPCENCLTKGLTSCIKERCIHGSLIKSILGAYEARYWERRNVYSLVDRYICPSQFMESMLLKRDIYKGKTVFLRNFVSLSSPAAESEKGDYVLSFGRLSPEKGLRFVLAAARALPGIPFVIAGSGPLEDDCKTAEAECPNVRFVGFKTGKALNDLIEGARFSLYPSVCYENCPMSILESQSLGTPVIASSLGGIPELVDDGNTGLIVDVKSDAFPQAIDALYHDRERLLEMSARCLALHGNGIDEYGKTMLGLYGSLVN